MALGATVYVFDIQLADADRGVYEALSLRVARHPSETEDFLLTRVLAYCLEFTPGIAFSAGGLSAPDEPAICVRDPTGALLAAIHVGLPEAERLHKAAKSAPRVAVYAHRPPGQFVDRLRRERIHRADEIVIAAVDPDLLSALAARMDRRMKFDLAVAGGTLYVGLGEETLTGTVTTHRLEA
ncbi:MAG: YaeQ family protein [Gammaproteobacteria bacterium]